MNEGSLDVSVVEMTIHCSTQRTSKGRVVVEFIGNKVTITLLLPSLDDEGILLLLSLIQEFLFGQTIMKFVDSLI